MLPERIETRDADAVVATLSRVLAPHEMDVRQPGRTIRAQVRHVQVAGCGLADLTYGAAVRIRSRVPTGRFLLHAVAEGQSRMALPNGRSVALEPGSMHVSFPGAALDIAFGSSSRHFTANLPVALWPAVAQTGEGHSLPVLDAHSADAWLNLMRFVLGWAELSPAIAVCGADHVASLIGAFLRDRASLRDPGSTETEGGPVPWFVRRARMTIREWVSEGVEIITLHEVAAYVGVGVRTLQSGLRRFAGRTFGEELREQRLCELDRLIAERGDQEDVTSLMQACGIVSMGRFAGYYRARFGMSPSDRLRRRH
jgi:AraC-like DNA-binding protein